MKKRLLSVLLVLCTVVGTVLSLMPVTAFAEGTSGTSTETETHIDLDQAQIYVGRNRIRNDRLSGDGWRFDKETDTLILNNFDIGGTSIAFFMGEKWEDQYEIAYIYVGGSDVNLKIRSEGEKENWIGGYECMDKPSTVIYNKWGGSVQYISYGIYNPNGTVTFSGSTPLNIYTNIRGIKAKYVNFESDTNVTVKCYSNSIHAQFGMHLAENSFVEAHAYAVGNSAIVAATYAVKSIHITVSKNAHLFAEIERLDPPVTVEPICAIYAIDDINVLGGKITAICRDDGRLGYKACYNVGIMARFELNVDDGGEVNAYVYNVSRKNYTGSVAIRGEMAPSRRVKFSGSGVIRAGVQMSPPEGIDADTPPLIDCKQTIYPEYARVSYSDMNNRPKDFDVYQEITVTAAEGIFLRDDKNGLQWTYYSDFQNVGGITKPDGTQDSIYLSGKELREVIANGPRLPVTIQSGKFYLNTASDDGKALTPSTIEIKKGAELVIFGEGKINDLNVIGEGKITFLGATVSGKVDKTVTMVVDGGNINVDYEGAVTTSGGTPVSRFEYTLMSDETTFEQATYVILFDGRDYGSAGMYPFDGKRLYLWLGKNTDVRYVSAVQPGVENGFTLYPTSANACLLEKTEMPEISKRSYYVAVPGQDSEIIPFEKGTDHANRYDLSWSFSDDGYTWHGISNQEAIGANGELKLTDVYSAWSNRMYRCEIRSKEDGNHTLLGVYTALLYIYDPEFRCEGGFVDGKEVTVRFTPTKQPGVSSCRISSIFWEVSEDGKHFNLQKDFSGKDSYTFTVSDEMDGWVLRCSAIAGNSLSVQNCVVIEKTYTIHVIEKKVRIEEQPENEQWIDRDSDENASVSVKARHATNYQWQVSKRPYVNSVGYGFEDIPGATDSTYSFPMKSVNKENWNYVYRCVVSNEYSEVISDEVYFQTKQEPEIMGFDARTTVGEGEEAAIDVLINQGNPSVANTTFWEVSTDGGVTYQNLWEVMTGDGEYDDWDVRFSYSGGISFTTSSSLRIYNVTAEKDGWIIRYTLNANGETMQKTAKLTVHQHEWSDKLTYDGENHWYACTVCNAKKDETAHSYGEGCDPYCTVCGRERAVSHDFRLMSSETEHWYQCADCELESDRQAHAYDNDCDADCNFCKRTREIIHSYEWQHDAQQHWQQCSKCGDIKNEAAHDFTAENPDGKYLKSAASCTEKAVFYKSCAVCGLSSEGTENEAAFAHGDVLGHDFGAWVSNGDGTHTRTCTRNAEHTQTDDCSGGTATCTEQATCEGCGGKYGELKPHSNATEWSTDETNHWHECTGCGRKAEEAAHADTDKDHKCDVCQKTLSECADTDKDHKCDLCGKPCGEHTGGTATCTGQAVCEVCGEKYGEPDASNHTELTHVAEKAATKTDEGNMEYWYCADCGKYFADKDATKEISKADTVTAKLPEEKPTSPKTGDAGNLALWLAVLIVSAGVIAAITLAVRKRKTAG